jgi:hypothetical protein
VGLDWVEWRSVGFRPCQVKCGCVGSGWVGLDDGLGGLEGFAAPLDNTSPIKPPGGNHPKTKSQLKHS